MQKMLVAIGVAACVIGAWGATVETAGKTWYVDDDNYGKTAVDGKTPETAYGSIQDAIDADNTKSGDTILVLPGVYSNGVKSTSWYPVRVYIDKALTIKSTGGRASTRIIGARNATAGGTAPESVACVIVNVSSGVVVVDGFILRDGCVTTNGSGGGGFDNRDDANKDNVHLIDCEVSGCYSAGSYIRRAQVHRCLIGVNRSSASDGQSNYAYVDNSIVYGAINGNGGYNGWFINCVVVGNENQASSSCDTYNTVYMMNGKDFNAATGKTFMGSVTTAARANFTGEVDDFSLFEVDPTSIFVSPAFFDFRLRADSSAIGRGNPKYLKKVKLPSGYDLRDYMGEPIDADAEICNPGPIQKPVATPSGLCTFTAAATGALIDGRVVTSEKLNFGYATSWPTQWCVTAAAPKTEPLSCLANSLAVWKDGSNVYRTYRYVGNDGKIWFMPPPANTNATITVNVAKDIRYVDANIGDDTWDGMSAVHTEGKRGPWKTLTRAGTNANYTAGQRVMIRCSAGIYAEEEGTYNDSRLTVSRDYLHFVGAAEGGTVIRGKKSESPERTLDGRGPGAVRCVHINSGSMGYTGFTGFTFADGYTDRNGNAGLVDGYRIIVGFTDCVATNIVGGNGLFNRTQVTAERCLLAHSRSNWYGLFYGSQYVALSGCVFLDISNIGTTLYPWFGNNALIANTTFVRGDGQSNEVTDGHERIYNSIFVDFSGSPDALVSARAACGCVIENCSGEKANFKDCVEASADFCDKRKGDFRLCSVSPAWKAPVVEESAVFSTIAATDFSGRPLYLTGVPLAAGAYADAPDPNAIAIDDEAGCLLANGGQADGYHLIGEGESLTVGQNLAFKRPVAGVMVNGETNLFDNATGTLTFARDEVVARGGVQLKPVLGNTWYVNAGADNEDWAAGSDDNTGFGRWSPKRTLRAGVANAIANDTVIAAPGRYDQEVETGFGLPCRVFVPDDVILQAEGHAEETFIVGANATADADQYGCGTDATRCVYLGKRSRIVGFTLTGGRSTSGTTSGSSSRDGAAALSDEHNAMKDYPSVLDCIVSNNVGSIGVLSWVNVVRCRVFENRTLKDMLIRNVNLRDVLFARNVYATAPVWGMYDKQVENITWAADNQRPDGKACKWGDMNANTVFRNCIFANNDYLGEEIQVMNCLFVNETISQKSMIVDPDRLHFDADYRPITDTDNALLDTGLNEIRSDAAGLALAKDASGRPRVLNGRIDIGALEADWRPRYAKDIGRHVTVTEATPGIVETDERKVSFGTGGTIKFEWVCEAERDCELVFNVTGEGMLIVMREGAVPVEYVKGKQVYAFKPMTAGVQKFSLTYMPAEGDTGSAEIIRAKRIVGHMLIVR